ncbi:PLP-dependent transferase [Suhomyces tanzawaensis NRRL Y-17324]|uniref:PLP-dependent transferase n=1 Tax=Suhomyces tanzawaensis NRRL Y-17324 TaxID=984487 RepID=A0A1E4SBA3_9ASCO|nr:PLP-dependent transferase [Suhomyces tanzawaensis NRRL Y-17324]ODV76758.1 PLP-dependent transferase [Suhomyces tanzawaensis NRRL Y-17324]
MVHSLLESNRVQELDELLTTLKPKLIEYIQKSDLSSEQYQANGLGTYHVPSQLKQLFFAEDMDKGVRGDGEIFEVIDRVLQYSVNTWHPGFLDKLYASNNPIGVVSDLLLSILNTNSHVYTVSPVFSVIENYIGRKYAQLFFNGSATCGGLTFPGGSYSNITSMHMARSLRYPDTKDEGNGKYKFAIYTSEHSHYSVEKSAILLGLGLKQVFKVATHGDGSMNVEELAKVVEETKAQGYTPLYINATAGTTVFGSYDDFTAISKVARAHNCHLHIDGSWGGNVIFSKKHGVKMAGSEYADSITVNPHKMLGVPNTCSFLLIPKVSDFQRSMSLNAPYLFHGREGSEEPEGERENYDLADGTMGCGRRPDAFKFYMAWLYYGQKGFEERVDHAFAIGEDFVSKISKDDRFELVVPGIPQCLQVCFYHKISGIPNTEVTRYVSRELHSSGKFLVDFSPRPQSKKGGEDRGEFFRVVFNSPILTDRVVDELIAGIIEAGEQLKASKK